MPAAAPQPTTRSHGDEQSTWSGAQQFVSLSRNAGHLHQGRALLDLAPRRTNPTSNAINCATQTDRANNISSIAEAQDMQMLFQIFWLAPRRWPLGAPGNTATNLPAYSRNSPLAAPHQGCVAQGVEISRIPGHCTTRFKCNGIRQEMLKPTRSNHNVASNASGT